VAAPADPTAAGRRSTFSRTHQADWLVLNLNHNMLISLGAFDRFNFGDLMFPHVLDEVARDTATGPVLHYALRDADMTRYGGVRPLATTGRHAVPFNVHAASGLAVILGGGEILGATWGAAAASLLPVPLDLALLAVRQLISCRLFDAIGKLGMRGQWPTPYLPDPDTAEQCVLVANAIGASSLDTLDHDTRESVLQTLRMAQYVSVRDATGRALLEREGIPATLAPDSVAILARMYRPTRPPADSTLVFQCSSTWIRSRMRSTVDALTTLSRQFARISFLPIGLAGGHDDQQALRIIRRCLPPAVRSRVDFVVPATVWDIAETIAGGSLFVGTSLHGNIAAMAYAVPSVGLEGVRKLSAYLATWGDGLTPIDVGPVGMQDAVQRALGGDPRRYAARAERLADESWANTRRVLRCAAGLPGWREDPT